MNEDKERLSGTSGWYLYQNEKLGYEIEFPREWSVSESSEGIALIGPNEGNRAVYVEGLELGMVIEGRKPVNLTHLELKENLRTSVLSRGLTWEVREETSASGVKWIVASFKNPAHQEKTFRQYVTIKDSSWLDVTTVCCRDDGNTDAELLVQILDTLR